MSGKSSVIVLLAALSLFMVAMGEGEPMLAVIAFFIGGVGLTGIVAAALKRKELPTASGAFEERLLQFEKRLQVTEDELGATNRLLTSLTAERDFDRQLYSANPRSLPRDAADPDRT